MLLQMGFIFLNHCFKNRNSTNSDDSQSSLYYSVYIRFSVAQSDSKVTQSRVEFHQLFSTHANSQPTLQM